MRRSKPEHPLRVMLVGCGRASAAHLRAIRFHEKQGQLVLAAMVDKDKKALDQALRMRPRRAPKPFVSDDVDEVLARQKIDIAVIATPPRTHAALGLKALQAGAHLIVEKPLALDIADASALCDTAREKGLKIAVGLKFRYIPGVVELKKWVENGAIGRLLYGSVIVRWGHDQAYYDQAPWFGTWEAEGGALMNQSIHALDLMTWLLDGVPVRATAVLARQAHCMEAADLAFGTLELAPRFPDSLYNGSATGIKQEKTEDVNAHYSVNTPHFSNFSCPDHSPRSGGACHSDSMPHSGNVRDPNCISHTDDISHSESIRFEKTTAFSNPNGEAPFGQKINFNENPSSVFSEASTIRILQIEGTTNARPDNHEASFFLRGSKGTVQAKTSKGIPKVCIQDDTGKHFEKKILFSALRRHINREGFGIILELGHPITLLFSDFLDAISGDRDPIVSGIDGMNALKSVLSLFFAAKSGETSPCPPPESFSLRDMRMFFENKK